MVYPKPGLTGMGSCFDAAGGSNAFAPVPDVNWIVFPDPGLILIVSSATAKLATATSADPAIAITDVALQLRYSRMFVLFARLLDHQEGRRPSLESKRSSRLLFLEMQPAKLGLVAFD